MEGDEDLERPSALYPEGLRIPPPQRYERGGPNETLFRVFPGSACRIHRCEYKVDPAG